MPNGIRKFDRGLAVTDVYKPAVSELHDLFRRRSTIRILIVADNNISFTEAPSGFGVGRVVRLLRESSIGCTRFTVDLARRDSVAPSTNPTPAPNEPRYSGFRFDQQEDGKPIINKYDEVWCFGFNPGNNAGPDSNITQPDALPASDAELSVLTTWMNDRKGGLLAMGDHDYLGASMCHRIPRIRSMRRWTNAQDVPPIGGAAHPDTHLRHDTNQPFTAAEIAGTAAIDFLNQEDSKPQPIDWVPWITQRLNYFRISKRPHPILCHPEHGPIDVMPDHPHEGWCFEDDEIDLSATYDFGSVEGPEYPGADGGGPAPMVIAHGWTVPNPPFLLDKGASPKKRFGMISVYDGHAAGVGRVATDSTWHHWFDENIFDIEAAGGENWDKISRYYLNVAKWLAPPAIGEFCFVFEVVRTHFTYLGFQEYSRNLSVFELGKSLHTYLIRYFGPCWVTEWVIDRIRIVDDDLWAYLKERLFWRKGIPFPGGDPCLSCPPFELLEIAVLGGLVRATFPVADEIRKHADANTDRPLRMKAENMLDLQTEGAKIGVSEFKEALARSLKDVQRIAR